MEENSGAVEETEDTTDRGKSEEDKRLDSEEAIFSVSTEPTERDVFEDSPDEQDDNNEEKEIAVNSTNIVKQIDFEASDIKECNITMKVTQPGNQLWNQCKRRQ